jgi:Domain of unknown function (DUF4173)
MTREGRFSLLLLAIALALGALGDTLFHGRPLGVGVAVWAVAFVVALALLLRVAHAPLHQGRRWMALPLLAFAAAFAWRDSPLLTAVNMLALAGAISLGALRRTEPNPTRAALSDYVAGLTAAGAAAFAGAARFLRADVPWREVRSSVRTDRAATIARGVGLALPLLALFGGLFAAADLVFRRLLVDAVPSLHAPGSHIALAAAFAWASAGLLRDLLASREEERAFSPSVGRVSRWQLGATEVAIALALLDLLFAAFVVVQARYLFGGRALVEAREHLTYAQYARHGFFELVVVAALVLPVLLLANAMVRRDERSRRGLVRLLSAALVVLVLVVIASALQRLWLYQEEYGLTELRIFATAIVLSLACVFLWLTATVLRGRTHRFAVGALVLGFVAAAALNAIDPDALIARTNLSRSQVDVGYLASLGDDAVPTLVARIATLPPDLRRALATALLARNERDGGWTAWNASRSRARELLRTHRDELALYAHQ